MESPAETLDNDWRQILGYRIPNFPGEQVSLHGHYRLKFPEKDHYLKAHKKLEILGYNEEEIKGRLLVAAQVERQLARGLPMHNVSFGVADSMLEFERMYLHMQRMAALILPEGEITTEDNALRLFNGVKVAELQGQGRPEPGPFAVSAGHAMFVNPHKSMEFDRSVQDLLQKSETTLDPEYKEGYNERPIVWLLESIERIYPQNDSLKVLKAGALVYYVEAYVKVASEKVERGEHLDSISHNEVVFRAFSEYGVNAAPLAACVDKTSERYKEAWLEALRLDYTIVPSLPMDLQGDADFMKKAIAIHPYAVAKLTPHTAGGDVNYKKIIEEEMKKLLPEICSMEDLELPDSMFSDKGFMKKAIELDPQAINLAKTAAWSEDELQKIVLKAVRKDGLVLQYSEKWRERLEPQACKDLVLEAIKHHGGGVIRWATEAQRDDREIVLSAVSNPSRRDNGTMGAHFPPLGFVSKQLRGDPEIVHAAVRAHHQSFSWVDPEKREYIAKTNILNASKGIDDEMDTLRRIIFDCRDRETFYTWPDSSLLLGNQAIDRIGDHVDDIWLYWGAQKDMAIEDLDELRVLFRICKREFASLSSDTALPLVSEVAGDVNDQMYERRRAADRHGHVTQAAFEELRARWDSFFPSIRNTADHGGSGAQLEGDGVQSSRSLLGEGDSLARDQAGLQTPLRHAHELRRPDSASVAVMDRAGIRSSVLQVIREVERLYILAVEGALSRRWIRQDALQSCVWVMRVEAECARAGLLDLRADGYRAYINAGYAALMEVNRAAIAWDNTREESPGDEALHKEELTSALQRAHEAFKINRGIARMPPFVGIALCYVGVPTIGDTRTREELAIRRAAHSTAELSGTPATSGAAGTRAGAIRNTVLNNAGGGAAAARGAQWHSLWAREPIIYTPKEVEKFSDTHYCQSKSGERWVLSDLKYYKILNNGFNGGDLSSEEITEFERSIQEKFPDFQGPSI